MKLLVAACLDRESQRPRVLPAENLGVRFQAPDRKDWALLIQREWEETIEYLGKNHGDDRAKRLVIVRWRPNKLEYGVVQVSCKPSRA